MNLLAMRCRPLTGAAMSPAEAAEHLARLPDWRPVDGAIERRFQFPDFHRTMAFVNAVAGVAHEQDHHPDLAVGYGHCTVRYSTHSVGGLSINDFICAAHIDALPTARPGADVARADA